VPQSKRKKQRNSNTTPSTKDLAVIQETFNALYKGLDEAKQLFESGRNNGRDGVIHAVESVLKFLEKSGPIRSHGLHAPLVALFDALMNLDDGVVRPILKKAQRSGRGRASAMRESIKGAAACTVHALRETGLQMRAAQASVARCLQKEGVTAERGSARRITARTVRGWCGDVAADVSGRGEAAQTFDLLQQECPLRNDADPELIRRKLLDDLIGLIRQLTPTGRKPDKPLS
jgi:hypothetical protein